MKIKKWNDFPKEGVTYIDINCILQNHEEFTKVIDKMSSFLVKDMPVNSIIVSPESRAHFFSSVLAYKHKLPVINLRKEGKYPESESIQIPYKTEYGEGSIYAPCIDYSCIGRIYIIDDVCATGNSFKGIEDAFKKLAPRADIKYITVIDISYLHSPIENHYPVYRISSPEQTEFEEVE